MAKYVLSIAARGDLDEILDYLIENASAGVAESINDKIEAALRNIAKNPDIGHQRSDLTEIPVRFWLVANYLIVYVEATSGISVVRILHSKRDIRSLLGDS